MFVIFLDCATTCDLLPLYTYMYIELQETHTERTSTILAHCKVHTLLFPHKEIMCLKVGACLVTRCNFINMN